MAGLIRREDIDTVRERTDLRDIVGEHVTLRTAGVGSWKGLCPFHDERSPSFTVRPQIGRYHCFGCGEKGDVFAFVQAMDHVTFTEAVEKLAHRLNYELQYEQGSGPRREDVGKRQRLVDAHKVAAEYFVAQLRTPGAAIARDFLTEKGFTAEDAAHFGVGYAPQGWDHLLKHLRGKGFTDEELGQTGIFTAGNRGLYDRFRGRLIWPIRTIAGETIGFGARRLHDDDQGPKYLNTPETALYKKSQVLYGLDLAKKDVARTRQLVVVEGYTDVMACHLAGIRTAVATCGTAFGGEHIKLVRRLLSDDGSGGEVIFTFDGDEAGQKAALKAFDEDQKFVAQTYVAVEPTGADPNDLRLTGGDTAVRHLLESRRPLFEFAIRATLKNFDLETVEGRVRALRASAPVVAGIRDAAIRPGYARELAGWLGMPVEDVTAAVAAAGRHTPTGSAQKGHNQNERGQIGHAQTGRSQAGLSQNGHGQTGRSQNERGQRGAGQQRDRYPQGRNDGRNDRRDGRQSDGRRSDDRRDDRWPDEAGAQAPDAGHFAGATRVDEDGIPARPLPGGGRSFPRPDWRDPAVGMERKALEVVLQVPGALTASDWDRFDAAVLREPAHRAVHEGIVAAGAAGAPASRWADAVLDEVPEVLRGFVSELAVTPLPASSEENLKAYAEGVLHHLFDAQIARRKQDMLAQLQRLDSGADADRARALQQELMELERQRRALRPQ
ncbi:DNA primase [Tersicoccus sp. Bi-70]|uniref:DNA primase n=1 Tax=Tersicoccus sp. Bi-70 TaxID=1897634 RepID=UPI00097686C0|nr:DNA primase [Tersicoccus sp. Bi-70]OMH31257.1 DNA primase [Tersicoccus sp. Bi-70]